MIRNERGYLGSWKTHARTERTVEQYACSWIGIVAVLFSLQSVMIQLHRQLFIKPCVIMSKLLYETFLSFTLNEKICLLYSWRYKFSSQPPAIQDCRRNFSAGIERQVLFLCHAIISVFESLRIDATSVCYFLLPVCSSSVNRVSRYLPDENH